MPKRILLITLILISTRLLAQTEGLGFSVGVSFSFGTEVNRIGFHVGMYANRDFLQLNTAVNGYYNFQSLALKRKTIELQYGIGFQVGFGNESELNNRFIGLTENNLKHNYTAGYTFLYYADQQRTCQRGGIFNINAGYFSFAMQNDLFGNFIRQTDRFRTGAFVIEYRYIDTKVGANITFWTADYSNCTIIKTDSIFKGKYGYYLDNRQMDRSISLGLASVQVRQWLPYNQQGTLNVGVSGEKVRNMFQNKLIHDQPFMPDALVWRKPPHIPMLMENGEQYLYRPGQKPSPSTFYFNVGLNQLLVY